MAADETLEDGRKIVDMVPSDRVDPRSRLPDGQRKGVTRTTLANGSVLTSYDDAPTVNRTLSGRPILDKDEAAEEDAREALIDEIIAEEDVEDPDPLEVPEPQRWKRDKPVPPKGGRDRWESLR